MIIEASVPGLIRTVLLIIGTFVALRFIGQLMIAKRNIEEERRLNAERAKFENDLKKTQANLGKTSVLSDSNSSSRKTNSTNIEDVDYEEVS